jgi:hypothetical protein
MPLLNVVVGMFSMEAIPPEMALTEHVYTISYTSIETPRQLDYGAVASNRAAAL